MNKTLCLIRHATAEESHASGKDFERRLASSGIQEARKLGETFSEKDILPDLIVASPSRRTRETAVLIGEVMGLPPKIFLYRDEIYEGLASSLLEVIGETAEAIKTLFVVGHNPGLSELVGLLGAELASGLHKAEAIALRWENATWKSLPSGKPKIVFQFRPA